MSLDILKQEAISLTSSSERLREIAAINDELARLVATNPIADSKLLEELALQARNTRNLEIQKAIASNPNTPKTLLIQLAYLFPEEFFANPIYELLIVENITFIEFFAIDLLFKLVLVSNTPASFLFYAANICQSNLKNIKNSEYCPHLTLESEHEIYIKRLQENKNYRLGGIFKIFWKCTEILIVIASHENTSRQQLLELSKSDEDVIAEIAKIRLKYDNNNNDLEFWNEIALYKKPNLHYILFVFPIHLNIF